MATLKTTYSNASVDAYLTRGDEQQRADCRKLITLLRKATGQKPRMWGPTIVGFGTYRYKYDSGHGGEAPVTGFAIRGKKLVVYVMPSEAERKALLPKLGPHSMGKSCLYFKRLDDLDRSVLEKLVATSVRKARRKDAEARKS